MRKSTPQAALILPVPNDQEIELKPSELPAADGQEVGLVEVQVPKTEMMMVKI